MLLKHNGFLLADVVGLGKTVIAAMVAKKFLMQNGRENTKILIVYPPAVEKNWKNTFKDFQLDKYTKFITNGSLEKILEGHQDYWSKEDYDLIIVDEAHKFRNYLTGAFQNLQLICKSPRANKGLIDGLQKKVILVTATPLNNRPDDIFYQIQMFQDARQSTLPITNLTSFFAPLMEQYKTLKRFDELDVNKLRTIYGKIRKNVIEPITIRRTRTDLENIPEYKIDLDEQGIKFPKVEPPKKVEYLMDEKLNELFHKTVFYLTDEDKLKYSRYQAIAGLKQDIQDNDYENAETVSKSLAFIMKTQLIKRLESSFYAFKKSLGNFQTATDRMIAMFENNKDKGAYYTPKEIVHYMCQESLIEYLCTTLKVEPEDKEGIAFTNLLKKKEVDKKLKPEINNINTALDSVKICDPAIRSGAFPMGLLHEIFTAKQTLHTFEHGNTKTFDASAVKLNIIQNSIYGVDIEKGAVDIARLRFWLSLIVDEEKPKALPNLDYKIVVGNSLVSKLGDDIIDIDWTLNETSHGLFGADLAKQKGDLLKKISKEQKEFFNPNSDKKKLAADIRKLKIDLLITQLELMVKTQGIETKPTGTNRNLAKQTEIYLQTIGWKNTIKDLQKLKTKTEVPLQFFDWKLDFPEVLNSVITDKYGFDIVIGNPPYGGKFTEADKQFFKGRFKNKDSETESYILFLELGGRLQSINGALWYIIPSNISTNPSYNNIRKHTLDNFSLQMIIDLGSNIFESASVDSCIFAFKNQKLESVKLSCGKISSRDLADSELKLFEQKYFLTTPQNIFNFYINTETSDLIGKIQSSASNKLSDFIDFSRGIEFGYSSDYVYDTKGRNRKPLIAGRCFNRYELRFDNKFVEVDFSDTSNFKTKAIYENPKIFVRRIGKEIIAYLDTENYYNVCDVYNLLPNSKKTDLNEILGLINSKCINYFFSNFFKNAKELFPKIPIKYLKEVPISLSNGKISKLTKSVQKRRIEGKDTKSLE